MNIRIFRDHDTLSDQVAAEILSQVARKPASVLCLATGDTPRLAYSKLTEKVRREKMDFSQCRFVALDEWVGVPPENPGSCHYFLHEMIFDPLRVRADHIHLFDVSAANLALECRKMDAVINEHGGIDLMLVGIGMNGHIGFNEPGQAFDQSAHIVELEEGTRKVGQKYFKQQTMLTHGVTLGLQQFLDARIAILMANGKKKSGVIQQALQGEVTTKVPASIVQRHSNAMVMIDAEAASGLTLKT